MVKILVSGFAHCGTSILKSIIGHIEGVYEVPQETQHKDEHVQKMKELGKEHLVIKTPRLTVIPELNSAVKLHCFSDHTYPTPNPYKDYVVILIIRDPRYVVSSFNRRTEKKPGLSDRWLREYEKMASIYYSLKVNPAQNVYCIQYEKMFDDNFRRLRYILDDIGLSYTDAIFDNTQFTNSISATPRENIAVPENIADHTQQGDQFLEYRTWQINQPFQNMNDPTKLNVTVKQEAFITGSKVFAKLRYV